MFLTVLLDANKLLLLLLLLLCMKKCLNDYCDVVCTLVKKET